MPIFFANFHCGPVSTESSSSSSPRWSLFSLTMSSLQPITIPMFAIIAPTIVNVRSSPSPLYTSICKYSLPLRSIRRSTRRKGTARQAKREQNWPKHIWTSRFFINNIINKIIMSSFSSIIAAAQQKSSDSAPFTKQVSVTPSTSQYFQQALPSKVILAKKRPSKIIVMQGKEDPQSAQLSSQSSGGSNLQEQHQSNKSQKPIKRSITTKQSNTNNDRECECRSLSSQSSTPVDENNGLRSNQQQMTMIPFAQRVIRNSNPSSLLQQKSLGISGANTATKYGQLSVKKPSLGLVPHHSDLNSPLTHFDYSAGLLSPTSAKNISMLGQYSQSMIKKQNSLCISSSHVVNSKKLIVQEVPSGDYLHDTIDQRSQIDQLSFRHRATSIKHQSKLMNNATAKKSIPSNAGNGSNKQSEGSTKAMVSGGQIVHQKKLSEFVAPKSVRQHPNSMPLVNRPSTTTDEYQTPTQSPPAANNWHNLGGVYNQNTHNKSVQQQGNMEACSPKFEQVASKRGPFVKEYSQAKKPFHNNPQQPATVFSPSKPCASMSITPNIQSKKYLTKMVQEVRELTVKKSLLAQESYFVSGSNFDKGSFKLSVQDSILLPSAFEQPTVKPHPPLAQLVKDYKTRSIVNQMTIQNGANLKYAREYISSKDEDLPFSKAMDVDDDDPNDMQTVEYERVPTNQIFNKVRNVINRKSNSIVFAVPKFDSHYATGEQNFTHEELLSNSSGQRDSDLTSKNMPSLSEFTCQCPRVEGIDYCCSKVHAWMQLIYDKESISTVSSPIQASYLRKMRSSYRQLTQTELLSDYEDQIMKDLARTFPKCEQFKSNEGLESLKRVLLAYSRYDKSIGYVQGMNFIVGSLLFHCSEDIAFWIFVTLIENFELRDVFEQQLPGLYKHCYVILNLLKTNHEQLYDHLQEHGIMVEMYASEWVFCLFSSIIPIDMYADFFEDFLKLGWQAFYRICMALLQYFKSKLLEEDEISGILYYIKFKSPEKNLSKNSNAQPSPFVLNETTGQLERQSVASTSTDSSSLQEKKLFSRIFDFMTRRKEPQQTQEQNEEKEAQEMWKSILNLGKTIKIEKGQIQSLLTSYQIEKGTENHSTDSHSSGNEEDLNATAVKSKNVAIKIL